MKETKATKASKDLKIQSERTNFLSMLAISPNYFGNIPGSEIKPTLELVKQQAYEQLTCVGITKPVRNRSDAPAYQNPCRNGGGKQNAQPPGREKLARTGLNSWKLVTS